MEKVFITGADGFIGSHLTETLVREGYDVKAVVLYNSQNSFGWLDCCADDVKGCFEVVQGDIRDAHWVKQSVSGCDAIAHLAALVAIPYSYISPRSYVDVNVTGTLNVLQAASECGVRRVINTSTSEVYGSAQFIPISEAHPVVGQSPYSASKIGADQLAYSFYSSFDLPVVTVRPFNTFGPRQSARAIIPTLITQILAGQETIKLGSTSPTRDFNFVKDTVNGFLAVLESDQGCGEVVNFGTGFEFSIKQTIEIIEEIMCQKINVVSDKVRIRPAKSEVDRLCCDNTKALKLFNWAPNYAGRDGFKLGLEETIEWFKAANNLKLYKPHLYNI